MTPTTGSMERLAAMPMAAPMAAVGLEHRPGGAPCSPTLGAAPSSSSSNDSAVAVKPWAFCMHRQGLTTDRSARHLGRPST